MSHDDACVVGGFIDGNVAESDILVPAVPRIACGRGYHGPADGAGVRGTDVDLSRGISIVK